MTDHYDDGRRAMARCEEHWLREPAWRTGDAPPCRECQDAPQESGDLCESCAAVIRAAEVEHLAALVRHDIATVARTARLRCVAAVVEAGPDAARWEMVSDDLRSRACVVGRDERATLLSATRAADAMRRGDVHAAALEFAEHYGLTVEVWAEETRKEMGR